MQDKVIRLALLVAVLALVVGAVGRLQNDSVLFSPRTWHLFAQTSLLFAIAWGVGRLLPKGPGAS